MDYRSIEEHNDYIKVNDVQNFNLRDIFECGQCFRWNETDENTYIGIAFGKVIEVKLIEKDLYIYNATKEEVENIWIDYFDLTRDYGIIKEELSKDPLLAEAIEFGEGIRLLKQDPFELIISFIISANNRIPMIKRAIDRISQRWGEKIEYKGNIYYTFPTIDRLRNATEEELKDCGVGFRGKYIKATVETLDDNMINEMLNSNDDQCHKLLQKLSGIGPKVADCIMLFSMEKYSAFPVDVWVKRAMQHFYLAPDVSLPKIREFARDKFGKYAGFAQQYLFYYARENKIII